MNAERWQRLEELFHRALEQPSEAREAFLDEGCGKDAALRAEVDRLLQADAQAHAFVGGAAAGIARVAATLAPYARRIGAYRIVAELGRGGMGTVYLGERDDAQFEMRVAIKLIKRGMDTDAVLQRFRYERQILAGLVHPNIARLLDGGTTEDGLPYFVLEYVDGKPIDEYCRGRGLTIDERLDLFRQVCDAVSYAHQHLVVHRDLKPTNIAVTANGVPKLLDFGIAKLLDRPDEAGTVTEFGAGAMTPQYASPEQLRGERVTTVSDVYALGVMLYELLTGRRPYDVSGLSPDAARQLVIGSQVTRPSAIAANAGDDALARRLRGDLDTIVRTATQRDAADRYASVSLLAEDVRRHREGLPVAARGDSWTYRAAMFVKRRTLGVAATAALGVALLGGAMATAWQAREARAQAQLAQQARARAERRFEQVRKLANAMIFEYHDGIKDLPGAIPVRAKLVRDALDYLNTLSQDSAEDASLQRELALAYRRVGDVQGGSTRINLGDTAGAAASYRKSVAILEGLLAKAPHDQSLRRDLAQVSTELANLASETGDMAGAFARARHAQALFEPLVAESPSDSQLLLALVHTYDTLGVLSLDGGKTADALQYHRRQLELLESRRASDAADAGMRRALSTAYHHAADAHVAAGDLDAALDRYRRALALRQSLSAEFPNNTDYTRLVGVTYFWIGDLLARREHPLEALDAYRRSLERGEQIAKADPTADAADVTYATVQVGNMLARLGHHSEALRHFRRAEAIRTASVHADAASLWKRASLLETRVFICGSLAALDRAAEASVVCAQAATQIEAAAVPADNALLRTFVADSYNAIGDAYTTLAHTRIPERRRGWQQEALEMYKRSVEVWADLSRRGIIAAADAGKPEVAARSLAKAEASLPASIP